MKLTFYSNYFNHHQKALCDCLHEKLGEDFTFVETEPMEEFRSQMGWGKEKIPEYVLKSHLGEEEKKKAYDLALESDVVIIGTAPEDLIEKRMEEDKLTFRYSERPLKEGRWKVLVPYLAKKFYINHFSKRKKNIYILAAGAFVSSDYAFLHSYRKKCYKFGYFPAPEELSFREIEEIRKKNRTMKVLWAGRFLKLKQPELLVYAAKRCRDVGLDLRLEFVGDGKEEKKIKKLVKQQKLDKITTFLGFLRPEDTRRQMEKADIFGCTSNKLEGWGSVIYEALSAGCAVIAPSKAGATPFLVTQGKTGYVFQSGNIESLADKLRILLSSPGAAHELGRNAYENMARYWNPKEASLRLLEVCEKRLAGRDYYFDKGPLSRAEKIKENWFKEKL